MVLEGGSVWMKWRKLLFLTREHSCFLNHSNIICAAIFIPVLPVAIMCSSCPPPTWRVKRSNGHFTPPPHAQYAHHGMGIKWGRVPYGVQSSDNSWWCCHSTAIFPLPTGKTILLLDYTLFGCLYAIGPLPTPRGPGGRPLYLIRCTCGYLTHERKLYWDFISWYICLCLTLVYIGLQRSYLLYSVES